MSAKDGVKVRQWPVEVLSALRAAWEELASEEGARDYFFKTVLDDIAKFRAGVKQDSAAKPAAAGASP
jgi:TRAP-type mannitol/chloroaromatic compound transport system substrate-binding protein